MRNVKVNKLARCNEINHDEILDLIDDNIPEDRDIDTLTKNKMIIGFANNYFPELQLLADNIKSDMAQSMSD